MVAKSEGLLNQEVYRSSNILVGLVGFFIFMSQRAGIYRIIL